MNPRPSVKGSLIDAQTRWHWLYVNHLPLPCCANGVLCETGLWLQSEADAAGRRVVLARGREPLF